MLNLPPELWLMVFDWALDIGDALHDIDPLSNLWTDLESRASPWHQSIVLCARIEKVISRVCKTWKNSARGLASRYIDVATMKQWRSVEEALTTTKVNPTYLRFNIHYAEPQDDLWTETDHDLFIGRPFRTVFRDLQALPFCAGNDGDPVDSDDPDSSDENGYPAMPNFLIILENFSKTLRYLEFKNALPSFGDAPQDSMVTDSTTFSSLVLNVTRFEVLEVLSLTLPDQFESRNGLGSSQPLNFPRLHSLKLYHKHSWGVVPPWVSWVEVWDLPALSAFALDMPAIGSRELFLPKPRG